MKVNSLVVAAWSFAKYRASTAALFNFCCIAGYSKPHTATEMDLRHCEFIEHAWDEGDSRNIRADARLGLMHFIKAVCGQLHGSQRLLRARSKNELPERADLLPIIAIVGAALRGQELRIAMSLLIGFHALVRTTEIIYIQASHFTFPQRYGPVLLVLPLTKSGQRLIAAAYGAAVAFRSFTAPLVLSR